GGLLLPQDEIVALYRAADAFVFPSLIETFGVVLIEAMAAGLPVLTTDAPGCRDIVRGGRDGMMTISGNVFSLCDGMSRLLAEPELRADLRARSLARSADFSWTRVVDRYETLYRTLIRDQGRITA
ncbi:MAG: glycosyltransferase family 4 protein, partial [Fimbriimonadaceae bacterium]|nr:glycosyltransferase family 4 protein [Alphaproteobacteria bacterium]